MSKRATRKAGSHPIDPLIGPKLALSGRVVMMDDAFTVLPRGVLYIEQGAIVAVREAGEAPPEGFQTVPVVNSRGTIFPGLIELHNHLAYNILRLWAVPRGLRTATNGPGPRPTGPSSAARCRSSARRRNWCRPWSVT